MYAETVAFVEKCRPLVTPEVLSRASAARAFVHKQSCPDPKFSDTCQACPTVSAVALALFHLDVKPFDAQGARVLLHDSVCTSRCEDGIHAKATQSTRVAAIRKFRIREHNAALNLS